MRQHVDEHRLDSTQEHTVSIGLSRLWFGGPDVDIPVYWSSRENGDSLTLTGCRKAESPGEEGRSFECIDGDFYQIRAAREMLGF